MPRGKRNKRVVEPGFGNSRRKRERGRPSQLIMPDPIDAPPERIAEVALQAKPKTEWRYLEEPPGESG